MIQDFLKKAREDSFVPTKDHFKAMIDALEDAVKILSYYKEIRPARECLKRIEKRLSPNGEQGEKK